jgi:uncharacterized membrane protein SirB2
MIELHPQIRLLHMACVAASGSLFLLRGTLLFSGLATGDRPVVRYLTYAIDTLLLGSALLLAAILRIHPGNAPWLAAKVVLLPVYIVLGSLALKRGRTRTVRLWCFIGALAVFLVIVGIARTHRPLGFLAWWLGEG